MRTSADAASGAAAAFFDLDKTLISRSSTLAFVPSFYRHGLISGAQAVRGALAQLAFRLAGADHDQMEKIKKQVSRLCSGWQVERVAEIVAAHLVDTIGPIVYTEAQHLVDAHKQAGRDVIIVSTSGLEMVGPIAAMLGASGVIATKMGHADGRYTGELEFYAYGEAKAIRIRELSAERGYHLADCFAYSDSVTDLPMLETVGYPHAVNPDRQLRKIATERGWPVLAFRSVVSQALRHVNSGNDKDHELITRSSSQADRSVVEMNHVPRQWCLHGNRVPTRDQPREAAETRSAQDDRAL